MLSVVLLLAGLLGVAAHKNHVHYDSIHYPEGGLSGVVMEIPACALTNTDVALTLSFPALIEISEKDSFWPSPMTYSVLVQHGDQIEGITFDPKAVVDGGTFDPYRDNPHTLKPIQLSAYGTATVSVWARNWTGPNAGEDHDAFLLDINTIYTIPGWLCIMPSIITVLVSILTKQVLIGLWSGLFLGGMFLSQYNPVTGFLRMLDTYLATSVATVDHASIIVFCFLLGGLIAVLSKGGGAAGMAVAVTRCANTRMKAQLATWAMGIIIFFDDYAATLVAGSTMRPITDSHYISREKLSFIVDTCAATVASLVMVSSWIGVEVSYIGEQLAIIEPGRNAYVTFLQTIPYRFYPLCALVFVLMTILTGREMGPMLHAERRAYFKHQVSPPRIAKKTDDPTEDDEKEAGEMDLDDADKELLPSENTPKRCSNAVVPLAAVIISLGLGLVLEGLSVLNRKASNLSWRAEQAASLNLTKMENATNEQIDALDYSLKGIIGEANPYHALLWSSMLGTVVAITLVVAQRILTLAQAMDAWLAGVKGMIMALLILIHAWALANMCADLHTAQWLVGAIGDLPAGLIPSVIFILSALISFATGSAWGTMSILFPLVMPLAYHAAPGNDEVLLGATASILAGSVWGDHCSPIADTCIMSSMSCQCPHLEHVRTQGYYAVLVAAVCLVFGSLPCGFGLYPSWAGLLIIWTVQLGLLMVFGKKVDEPGMAPDADEKLLQGTRGSGEAYSSRKASESYSLEVPIMNDHYHSMGVHPGQH